MHYKDNWITWNFDNKDYSNKKKFTGNFSLSFNKIVTPDINTFYTELCNNAKFVYENHRKLILFFSGGINSQIILNIYKVTKIPIKVIILKFNKNYNDKEFSIAQKICEELSVPFEILDFDIDSFFENHALDLFNKTYTLDPYKLILLHASYAVDDTPIMGNKFPYIFRSSYNYSQTADWFIKFCAEDFIFQTYTDRIIIGDWFHYSYDVILSLLENDIVKQLISDRSIGKQSILSSRTKLLKDDIYLLDRDKSLGLDSRIMPDSMVYFFNTYMKDKLSHANNFLDYKILDFKSQIYL
jgi:hypothetical protein